MNNLNEEDQKERFLKGQHKLYNDITAEINSISTMNSTIMLSRERWGMLIALISTFFMSLNCFYAKVILKAYPEDFDSIEFLFVRGFAIIIFGLIHTYITKIKIFKLSELPLRFWFLTRCNSNFFYNAFSVTALWYLRASTVQILILLSPLVVIVLSYFILNEPLYIRYLIGGIMCISGSIIIILKENKITSGDNSKKGDNNTQIPSYGVFLGVFFCLIAVGFTSIINIASKILASHRVSLNNQIIYIGAVNMMYSFAYILIRRKIFLKIGYILMCFLHGFFFYAYYASYNRAL